MVKHSYKEPEYETSPKFDEYRRKPNHELQSSASKRYEDAIPNSLLKEQQNNMDLGMTTSRMMLKERDDDKLPPINHPSVEPSLKLPKKKHKHDKKSKKKKSKKDKKSKKKRRDNSQETTKTKAKVIVSRKFVRQATNQGMSLGEFIKHKNLKLVEPSKKELRRYSISAHSGM